MPPESQKLSRAEASRLNGAKSNGPVTLEGKLKSSQNAVKHGFRTSAMVLLPSESQEEFAEFYAALHNQFQPVDALQLNLVERVVNCAWRLRRVGMLESSIFEVELLKRHSLSDAFIQPGMPTRIASLNRYEASIENSMFKALRSLRDLQAAQRSRETANCQIAQTNPSLSSNE